jgi:hypothetical protein
MNCPYSLVVKPCVIREPAADDCRACLKSLSENQNQCCRCGSTTTYDEFKRTGKAHVCKDMKEEANV